MTNIFDQVNNPDNVSNISQMQITPLKPKILANERIYVYVPKASIQHAGIASYSDTDFSVINGKVSLVWNIPQMNEDIQIAINNSLNALSNSEDALETAIAARNIATGIDAKANEALSNSEDALETAIAAGNIATGIDAKANEALSNSETALSNSETALSILPFKADLVDGKIPANQLPSYMDDVIEVDTFGDLPIIGESGKIYVTTDTNLTYRWSGTQYTEISKSLALGETSATAYRGDSGKIAYDHSQLANGANPHLTTFANIESKPTTISGYGITDAYTKTELNNVINNATIIHKPDADKTYLKIKISVDNDEFTLLTGDSGSPNYTIEWGDGVSDNITDTSNPTHIYEKARMYLITISGDFANGIVVESSANANKAKMIEVYAGSNYPASIGNSAFFDCTNLTTVTFPSATSIGNGTFYNCSNLTTVTFPSATSIDNNAFNNCTNLTTVTFPSATSIGNIVFSGCSNLTTATFPNITSISDYTFYGCSNLTTATFPKATSIGNSVFYNCTRLTTATFPNATSIGDSAFDNCSNLTTATFPKATSIGNIVFSGCSNLTTATFPNITSISDYAFRFCSNLKHLTIGNVITTSTGGRFTTVKLDTLTISGTITDTDITRIKKLFTDNGGTFSQSCEIKHGLQVNKTPTFDNDVVRKIDLDTLIPSLALGETSSTAFRGDWGKIAYDHSQLTSGNPHNVTKSDVGLGNVYNPTAYGGISYGGGAGESGVSFTDLNSLVYTGFYTCFGTTANVPSASYSWYIEHINSNVGNESATQTAIAYGTTNIIYKRNKISSTWGDWENISPSLKLDKTTTGSVRRVYGINASNAQELTEIETTPTTSSSKLVTSGGVKTALDLKLDKTTSGSLRRVYGVNSSNSQELTEIENTPTAGSTKLVTSGGIKTALNAKANFLSFGSISISRNDWVSEGIDVYKNIVSAPGVMSTFKLDIDLDMSGLIDSDSVNSKLTAWSKIYRAESDFDRITFYATEIPEISFNVNIKGVI